MRTLSAKLNYKKMLQRINMKMSDPSWKPTKSMRRIMETAKKSLEEFDADQFIDETFSELKNEIDNAILDSHHSDWLASPD